MGLAAFNRMRRLQAQKEKEGVKNANNDTPKSKKQPANKRNK